MTEYTLDTNLYIRAYRSVEERARLDAFLVKNSPRIHLHVVVLHELMLGARTRADAQEIHREVGTPLQRVGRVITPTRRVWQRSAEAVAFMVERGLISRGGYTPSFLNDVLIAASCREAGVTLVTANTADFERIAEVEPFEFAPPWPSGAADA